MTEKPLHVRVAEALGAKPFWSTRDQWECKCKEWEGCPHRYEPSEELLRYDSDWNATGPLIEKRGIALDLYFPGDLRQDGFVWRAWRSHDDYVKAEVDTGDGPTPLVAVCNLILKLRFLDNAQGK